MALTLHSRTTTAIGSASTTHNINLPSTVNAGDLILCALGLEGVTVTTPTNWANLHAVTSGNWTAALFSKVADGTEGGTTENFSTDVSSTAAAHVFRLSEWSGYAHDAFDQSGGTTAPNPPAVSFGDTASTIWIVMAICGDDDVTMSGFPSSYGNTGQTKSGGGTNSGPHVSSAWRTASVSTENPGSFTLDSSESALSITFGIREGVEINTNGGGGLPIVLGG